MIRLVPRIPTDPLGSSTLQQATCITSTSTSTYSLASLQQGCRRRAIVCSGLYYYCMLWSFSILSRYVVISSSFIASRVECCTSFFSIKNPNNWAYSLIALTAAEYCFLAQASLYTTSSFSTS